MRMTLEISPLRIRSLLRRSRRRVAALAVLAVLIGAVALHHAPSLDMDMHTAGVCLAVLQIAVGVALVAVTWPVAEAGPRRLLGRRSVAVSVPITVPARAGPWHLQVLRL